jgi:hypothetical protein
LQNVRGLILVRSDRGRWILIEWLRADRAEGAAAHAGKLAGLRPNGGLGLGLAQFWAWESKGAMGIAMAGFWR